MGDWRETYLRIHHGLTQKCMSGPNAHKPGPCPEGQGGAETRDTPPPASPASPAKLTPGEKSELWWSSSHDPEEIILPPGKDVVFGGERRLEIKPLEGEDLKGYSLLRDPEGRKLALVATDKIRDLAARWKAHKDRLAEKNRREEERYEGEVKKARARLDPKLAEGVRNVVAQLKSVDNNHLMLLLTEAGPRLSLGQAKRFLRDMQLAGGIMWHKSGGRMWWTPKEQPSGGMTRKSLHVLHPAGRREPVSIADADPDSPGALARAQAADLVTFGAGVEGARCANCEFVARVRGRDYCRHPEVRQFLPDGRKKQCCSRWDRPGTRRRWEHQGNGFTHKSYTPDTTRAASPTTSDPALGDDLQRAELMADILGGLLGERALELFAGESVEDSPAEGDTEKSYGLVWLTAKAWDELQHPRGKNGRFIKKGSAESVASAKLAVRQILRNGPAAKSPEHAQKLAEHLSILTVKQLHELKREYGLKASGPLREQLVAKLLDRLPGAQERMEKELAGAAEKLGLPEGSDMKAVVEKIATDAGYPEHFITKEELGERLDALGISAPVQRGEIAQKAMEFLLNGPGEKGEEPEGKKPEEVEQPAPEPQKPAPVAGMKATVADALRGVLGDKADEAAQHIGLSLYKYRIADALKRYGGMEHEAAMAHVPAITEKMLAYLKENGIEPPDRSYYDTLPEVPGSDAWKEEREKWKQEREREKVRVKEFAEANYKQPPAPDQVTSKEWVAMRTRQKMAEVEKDREKLKALAERFEQIEAGWRTNPNYDEDFRAIEAELQRPVNVKLRKKYKPDWMTTRGKVPSVTEAAHEAQRLHEGLQYNWDNAHFSEYTPTGAKAHAEHMEAIKKAVEDPNHELPEKVVDEFEYESWLPKKYGERRTLKRSLAGHQEYLQKEHAYGNGLLQKAMEHAAPQIESIMQRARAVPPEIAETRTASDAAKQRMEQTMRTLQAFEEPFISERTAHGYSVEMPNDRAEEWQRLADEHMAARREYQERERAAEATAREAGARWLDSLLPEGGNADAVIPHNEHLNDYGRQELQKANDFLRRVVGPSWGKMKCNLKQLESGYRSYCSGDDIVTPAAVDASTLVHEYGHLIEHQGGNTLGTLSKAFAMAQVQKAGEPMRHMGTGYEATEIGAKDDFLHAYTGKFYPHDSSEILSMGIQQLYDNPMEFWQKSPEHFKYTLAALHGLLT